VLPLLVTSLWYFTFLVLAATSLAEDVGISSESCGKATHIWKYCFLNAIFGLIFLVTYCVFPGGGEGARARAALCIIFHFGFLVWGYLMWVHMTTDCQDIMKNRYSNLYGYSQMCIVHNAFCGIVIFLHETFLGTYVRSDYTVVAEIKNDTPVEYIEDANIYHQGSENKPPPFQMGDVEAVNNLPIPSEVPNQASPGS